MSCRKRVSGHKTRCPERLHAPAHLLAPSPWWDEVIEKHAAGPRGLFPSRRVARPWHDADCNPSLQRHLWKTPCPAVWLGAPLATLPLGSDRPGQPVNCLHVPAGSLPPSDCAARYAIACYNRYTHYPGRDRIPVVDRRIATGLVQRGCRQVRSDGRLATDGHRLGVGSGVATSPPDAVRAVCWAAHPSLA